MSDSRHLVCRARLSFPLAAGVVHPPLTNTRPDAKSDSCCEKIGTLESGLAFSSQRNPEMSDGATIDPLATRASLLLRLKSDGPQREVAWRDFHGRYGPVIASYARAMGVRRQDIDDVVQDVLMGFYAATPEFNYDPARGRFRSYLRTCVWRKIQRRMEKLPMRTSDALEWIGTADRTWDEIWESHALHRALAKVRDRYDRRPDRRKTFLAFEMYSMLGRPADEVATELGISVASVHAAKSRVSRAVAKLARTLAEAEG